MRYRLQVERGPLTKIAIFKPEEVGLPYDQKTYFTEVSIGLLGEEKTDFLEVDDLFIDGDRVGIDKNRLQQRLGHADLDRLIMPADTFRKFLNNLKDNSKE